MTSAFGVDLGEISKAADPAKLIPKIKFKPIVPKKVTGPGSERGKMDPTAWATRTAAHRRGE